MFRMPLDTQEKRMGRDFYGFRKTVLTDRADADVLPRHIYRLMMHAVYIQMVYAENFVQSGFLGNHNAMTSLVTTGIA